MRRRSLLAMPLVSTMLAARPAGALRLSVRVEPLFPSLTLPAQVERVAAAGYQGFEFGDWREIGRAHV